MEQTRDNSAAMKLDDDDEEEEDWLSSSFMAEKKVDTFLISLGNANHIVNASATTNNNNKQNVVLQSPPRPSASSLIEKKEIHSQKKHKELEVVGHPWGRNKTFSTQSVARFVVDKVIRNEILPDALVQDVPIHAIDQLPTYSPFISFHLVLILPEMNIVNTGGGNNKSNKETTIKKHQDEQNIFIVTRIISCRTREITEYSLREYLIRLYDSSMGGLYETSDLYKIKSPSSSSKIKKRKRSKVEKEVETDGEIWYEKYVYPFLKSWPKDGLDLENIDEYLNRLYRESEKYCKKMNSKDKTDIANFYNDIYTNIYSKIKPCLRGALFEHLLAYFHESFLYSLTRNQQLAIYFLMNERPELLLFWPLAVFHLEHLPDPLDESKRLFPPSSGPNVGDLFQLRGREKHMFNFQDQLMDDSRLFYDPTIPMWNVAKYIQCKQRQPLVSFDIITPHPREHFILNEKTTIDAFRIYLNIERHLYYSDNTCIPYSPTNNLSNKFYSELLSGQRRQSIEFLLNHDILVENRGSARYVQSLSFYFEECRFVQILKDFSKVVLFIDSEVGTASPTFLRKFKTSTKLFGDLASSMRNMIFISSNEENANYQSSILSRPVINIFSSDLIKDPFTAKESNDSVLNSELSSGVCNIIVFLNTHKIPLVRINAFLDMLISNNNGREKPILCFCGDSGDSTNHNFKSHAFVGFDSIRQIKLAPNSKFQYLYWTVEDMFKDFSTNKILLKSITNYHIMKKEQLSQMDKSSLKNKKDIISVLKKHEDAFKKDPNKNYAILCSNEATKRQLLLLLFNDKKRFRIFTFYTKNYVFVEQTNTRGKITQAWVREDDKSEIEVRNTQEMDLRRNEHILKVNDHKYSSEKTAIEHSTFDVISQYVGTPVHTIIFVATKQTTKKDLLMASKYALDTFQVHYSFDVNYSSLSTRSFPMYCDIGNKLLDQLK